MKSGKISRRGTMQAAAAIGIAEMASTTAEASAGKKPGHLAVLHSLIAAWKTKDIDGVLSHLTEDIEWHYLVGLPPLKGKPAARAFLEKFGAPIAEVRWRIFDAAVIDDRMLVEGVDEYFTTNGGHVVVPYMGILQFRDGLIFRWRDYADSGLAGKLKNGEPVPDYVTALVDRKAI